MTWADVGILYALVAILVVLRLASNYSYQRKTVPDQPLPEIGQVWYPAWWNLIGRRVKIVAEDTSPVDDRRTGLQGVTDSGQTRSFDRYMTGYVWYG